MGRKVGEHDFIMPRFGSQGWGTALMCYKTFSVGVFAWVPALSKSGIKRGAAKVRVSGPATSAGHKLVHDKAQEIANALDAGTYDGPKLVRVGLDNM